MFKLIVFYKPIHDELKKLQNGWTNKRDKYEEAHRAELTLWNAASRYLHANLPKGTKTLPIAEWEQEYADLKTQRDSDYTKLKDTRTNVSELQKIRKCVDIALPFGCLNNFYFKILSNFLGSLHFACPS